MTNTPKPVILNVDDYEAGRYASSRVLRQAGFEVVEAATGGEALALAQDRPDLIVLDVHLPDTDGFEVCRQLKGDPRTAEIPVLQMSAAYRAAGDRARGLEGGADAYLAQPVEPRELIATVQALLRGRQVADVVRQSERRFRSLVRAISQVVWTTSPTGEFVGEQPEWAAFTGQAPEEYAGRGWLEAVHPADRAALLRAWDEPAPSDGAFEASVRLRRADGEYCSTLLRAVPVRDENGVAEWVGAHTDLSEHLRLYHEAQQASRAKSDFLATMSHELRTPLNGILGYLDLLELEVTGRLSPVQKEQVSRSRSAACQLLQMIEEILTFSRIEAGREELQCAPVDLGRLVSETAGLLEPLAREKGLAYRVAVPPEPLVRTTDGAKVRQIVLNLLSNAVKFTGAGEVCVRLEADGADGAVRLRVADTGIGIPPEALPRVFEPFWQVEQSTARRVGGTGLGLSVARRLTELLGGEIRVHSEPGRGSSFEVEF